MKKLDDAIRRFGKPERVIDTGLFLQGFDQDAICKHFKVPVGMTLPTGVVLEQAKPFIKLNESALIAQIERQEKEIEALNKLLDERDETIDCMVHSPQEIIGWLTCAALVVTVFLAHGLGYL